MHTSKTPQPHNTHRCTSPLAGSRVRRLALSTALVVPALAAPMVSGVAPAYAACDPALVADGDSTVCSDSTTSTLGGGLNNISVTVLQGADITVGGLDAIFLGTNASITNSGTISGGEDGIVAANIGDTGNITDLTNSGTISGDTGDGVFADVNVTNLTNSGTISGDDDGIQSDFGNIIDLTNSGTISGGGDGIFALNGNLTNDGDVTNLTNSGTINGGDDGIDAAGNITNLTNSGTISGGNNGMEARVVVSLINSGIISGGDYAIRETLIGNTSLTLNAGSILIGGVDLGGGVNTLNIGEGLSINSTLESADAASRVGLGTTDGHLVALVPVAGSVIEIQVVAVDQSAFSGTGDALATLTSGIGGVVQGRQSAVRSDPALGFASRFAEAEETSLAAFSDLDLTDAPHLNPNRFWIEGFGAYRQDDSDRVGSAFESLTGGLVAGVDVPLDALTSVGAMAGFAASTSENELETQTTDATSFYAGVYASTQAGGIYWDASLTLGYTDYDSERTTANNLVANGLETARADFGGWFVNPQITATREAANPFAGSGFGALVATNTLEQSLTLSYAGLFLDGYTETGTTNPLTLDDRAIHVASARAALALPFEAIHADGAVTTLRLIGGVEARTQFGDDSVSGTLLGQAVSTTLNDDDFTAGAFIGLAGEYQTTTGMTAYANAEGLIESDASWQLSATAGLRIAF